MCRLSHRFLRLCSLFSPLFSSPFLISIFKFIDSFIYHLHSSENFPRNFFFWYCIFFKLCTLLWIFLLYFLIVHWVFFIHHNYIFLYPVEHSHSNHCHKSRSSWVGVFFPMKMDHISLALCMSSSFGLHVLWMLLCVVETLNSVTLTQRLLMFLI